MNITGSSHIKSFTKGHSFKGLRQRHLEVSDRGKKVAKRPELVGLNKKYIYRDYDEIVNEWNGLIEEYNMKPSQRKNKSRRLENIQEYVDKKQSHKTVNVDFNGVDFMMVSKLGNMEDWSNVVELFASHGVSEEETLECLNDGFDTFTKAFNERFKGVLECVEMHTNLDELGSPHCHMHVCSTSLNDKGLPETNMSNMLKKVYGNKYNKEMMSLFREEVDSELVNTLGSSLCDLAQSKGFEFSGLQLVRLEAENVGLTHERYVEEQMVKSNIKEREEALNEREKELNKREEFLNNREGYLNRFEESLYKSKDDLNERRDRIMGVYEELDEFRTRVNERDEFSFEQMMYIGSKVLDLNGVMIEMNKRISKVDELAYKQENSMLSDSETRMKQFMETLKFKDGTTARDRFERQEYELMDKRATNRKAMEEEVEKVKQIKEELEEFGQSIDFKKVQPIGKIELDKEDIERIVNEDKVLEKQMNKPIKRRVVKDLIDYSNYDKDDFGPEF